MTAIFRVSQLSTRLFNASRTLPRQGIVTRLLATYPDDRKYTKSHEWVKSADGIATIGISNHAQEALGDIVFVELPEVGTNTDAGEAVVTVESVKASEQVYAPIGGEVIEVNETLPDSPETVNSDPHGDGWMFKLKIADQSQVDALMSSVDYIAMEAESH